MENKDKAGISVIMPTYNQGSFISRSIVSLMTQTYLSWELIIINDGSSDYTFDVISNFLTDIRIKYIENKVNMGLGYCLNKGVEIAEFDLISYLPSDDIFFSDHLQSLYQTHRNYPEAVLVYSGVKSHYQDEKYYSSSTLNTGLIMGYSLQLVQVMHKKSPLRWMERPELVTDDLNKMFFSEFLNSGLSVPTNKVTCEWIDHPEQRHKIIKETESGGINLYKQFYNIKTRLKFQSSVGNFIDEEELFKDFRSENFKTSSGLKILLVGELAYNAERVVALEEHGHKLYGLWMNSPHCYNTVGPLPFGNIEDIPFDNWLEKIKEIAPDIIYALLNHQAVPFAHYVMTTNPDIPFVWHFKEGPFFCRQNGLWKELIELYMNSDGQIYINPEVRDWFEQFICPDEGCSFLLDGDLPKQDYFTDERSPLLSKIDGEIHTVLPGRPMGITPWDVAELAKQKIHFHFYGEFQQSFWRSWIDSANEAAPGYLHIHSNCDPQDWTKELSKYDAGWLHIKNSTNGGEMMKANWFDLNYAARMTTLAAAGLPMLQKNNEGHISATFSLINKMGMGINFDSFAELGSKLRNKEYIEEIRENVWNNRLIFSFDYHVNDLTDFFKRVIKNKRVVEAKR